MIETVALGDWILDAPESRFISCNSRKSQRSCRRPVAPILARPVPSQRELRKAMAQSGLRPDQTGSRRGRDGAVALAFRRQNTQYRYVLR
jgi:hypothetical protein